MSWRWGLLLPLLAAGCGDGGTTKKQVLAAREQGLRLPRVVQVGHEPPAKWQIRIRVTREATIHVGDSAALSMNALKTTLLRRLKTMGDRAWEPDGSSAVAALLDVDETMPWVLCQWLLQTCADPRLKIYKIFFGAVTEQTEEAGALATQLPKDNRPCLPDLPLELPPRPKVKIFGWDGEASDLDAFHTAFLAFTEEQRKRATVEIVAVPPDGGAVPSGYVMGVLDVLFRTGVRDVVFEGAPGRMNRPMFADAKKLAAHVRALRARNVRPRVKLDQLAIGGPPEGPPPRGPTGRARGTVGMDISWPDEMGPDDDVPLEIEEEIEEREEEIDEIPEQEITAEMPVIKDEEIDLPDGPLVAPANQRALPRDKDLRDAVDHALRWLAAHQNPNGAFQARDFPLWCDGKLASETAPRPDGAGQAQHDVGTTGLALAAFLGAGYTNRGKHPYARVVSRGLRYLKLVQDDDGCFGPRNHAQWIYCHALATLAIVEAYRQTGSPIFATPAKRAIAFLLKTRNPGAAWRYGIRPGDNDTSVTGWALQAVASARRMNAERLAEGKPEPFPIDPAALDEIRSWIDRMTDPATGRVGYVTRGSGPARGGQQGISATLGIPETVRRFPHARSESMTAAALWGRLILGETPEGNETMQRAAALLVALPPSWNTQDGSIDLIYWYYRAFALYSMPIDEKHWKQGIEKAIITSQRKDTTPCQVRGSWDPVGAWGMNGGRVYATAMMAMCLELYYRYHPIHRLVPK